MFTGIRKAFVSAIFPTRCQACQALFHPPDMQKKRMPINALGAELGIGQVDLDTFFQDVMAPFVCRDCIILFSPMETPYCPECGKMFAARSGGDHVCGACIVSENQYRMVRSAGLLEGVLPDVIHAFKYSGKIQLAKPLGRILLAVLMRDFIIDDIDMIIPVPLHRARLKHRGFNQAVLMLREWLDFPPIRQAGILIEKNILVRTLNTVSQTGLGKEKRKANVRKAFAVTRPEVVRKKRVLLVDDVFTTGATCGECARMLIRAGADAVSVLTLAHAG